MALFILIGLKVPKKKKINVMSFHLIIIQWINNFPFCIHLIHSWFGKKVQPIEFTYGILKLGTR